MVNQKVELCVVLASELLLTEQKLELLCVVWQRPGRQPEKEGGLQSSVLTLPSAAACDF